MSRRDRQPILLVEDDMVDSMTVKRALRDINVTNKLVIRENGEDALAYLRDESNEKPCIIIMDLNMPKMNGLELLKALKADEELRRLPVVVLTTSQGEQDRFQSFDLSVAGYMIKPVEYPQFVEVVRNINMYWTLSELSE